MTEQQLDELDLILAAMTSAELVDTPIEECLGLYEEAARDLSRFICEHRVDMSAR